MTTIAFKDGVLAADTLVSAEGVRSGYTTKIRKIGPVLAGGSGRVRDVQAFLDWFVGGMDGEPPETGGNAEGLLFFDGHILTWNDGWDRRVRCSLRSTRAVAEGTAHSAP